MRSSSATASRWSVHATRRSASREGIALSSPDPSPAAEARLYLVTPTRPDLAEFLEAAVRGGVDIVQIRERSLTDRELLVALDGAREVTHRLGVPLVVNDRPD